MQKNNLPLIVGIALPIIFIIIISIIVFTPSLFVKPQYNFLYSFNNSYYDYSRSYANIYEVKDSRLSLVAVATTSGYTYKDGAPPLYLYDVKNNTSHQISFDEAKNLTLDAGPSSPDGYLVKYDRSDSGIFELFGSSGYSNYYVIYKNNGSKKLNILNDNGYYYYNFKVIGWVK